MNKEEAQKRLDSLEIEAKELRKIIDAPEKPTARDWLLNFLSQTFEVKFTKGIVTYYLDGQWIFQQHLKDGVLWCCYHKVWRVFEDEYNMRYNDIQSIMKDVVGEALNCKGLTPAISDRE